VSYQFVQDFTFESTRLEESMLETAINLLGCRTLFRRTDVSRVGGYPSQALAYLMDFVGYPRSQNLARWVPPDDERRADEVWCQPVCRLAPGGSTQGFEEEIVCSDRAELVRRTMELVRAADLDGFARDLGEGPFRGCDGTVVPGFQLRAGSMSSRGTLHVSMCLIYLPK